MRRIRFCLLGLLLLCFSATSRADVIIIAHKDNPESSISARELQEIFLGKRVQWKDNSTIHPSTVKGGPLHEDFLKQYVKKSPSQWIAYWKRIVFTGNGTPPKQFASQEELLEYVANTRGAIGYTDEATTTENVAILPIK